jgi:hypothetical protein
MSAYYALRCSTLNLRDSLPARYLFPFWLAEWKVINAGKSGFVCLSEASLEACRIDGLERRNPEGARQGVRFFGYFLVA